MATFENVVVIGRPIEDVFAFLSDFENVPRWWSARTGLTLQSRSSPTAPRCPRVVLTGRVTSVPFIAVLNGPDRTSTDNHEAASTCAVPDPRK